jgi:hypothetical protein
MYINKLCAKIVSHSVLTGTEASAAQLIIVGYLNA